MARWVETDAHPLTYLDPDHHDRTHQAWLDACEGTDRVGHAVVRTILPLNDGQDRVVAPPGWYRATIIDCTDADGLDVIVFGLEPSSEHEEQDYLAGLETEPGDTTSWFGGTTTFRLRLDVDAVVRGGTMNVAEVLGRPLVDLLGQAFVELAHPDDLPTTKEAWRSILDDPSRPAVVRTRLATTDRGWRWFEATVWNLFETAKYDAVIAEFRDVDDLVAIELARADAAREHSRLLRIFDEVDDRVMVAHFGAGLVYLNRSAASMFPGEPLGKRLVDLVPQRVRHHVDDVVMPLLDGMQQWAGDVELVLDGETRTFATTATPVSNPGDDGIFVGVIMRDVTADRHHAQDLARQARIDPLTGLPNRLGLMEHLDACGSRVDGQDAVSVCFIDLDNLKVVNDGLGHGAGDLLLQAVGQELSSIAGQLVARFGGDEFVVVYDGLGPAAAHQAAEDLLAQIKLVQIDGVGSQITASAGVASTLRGDLDSERLLRDADAAMYVAKRAGRARVVTFDDDMRTSVSRRFMLEVALREALAADQLELHLQPIIDLQTDEISGFEGLARWDVAAPSEFIPVAEDAGLISELGEWALREVLRAAATLAPTRVGASPLRVGVNVSAEQLLDPSFSAMVFNELERSGIPPDQLILELTETVLIDHREASSRVLNQLHDAGVTIALDDFGTGYSSLGYLPRYPIDVLKLDNTYTQSLITDEETRIIVESVMMMAKRLGIRVVAEGVETSEQLDAVRSLGIDWAQGYLLGRPGPVASLIDWVNPVLAD